MSFAISRSTTSAVIAEHLSIATSASRTIQMAALVTIADAVLAFPIAYYMARVASPRTRDLLVVAILLPLWASYLVKIYAWRTILSDGGIINWALEPFGVRLTGTRRSASGSSSPTSGCRTWCFRSMRALSAYRTHCSRPQPTSVGGRSGRSCACRSRSRFPAVVAGSIFTFSLTLGDFISPRSITSEQFIGTVIYGTSAWRLPFAAAYSVVPIVVMVLYLVVAGSYASGRSRAR